MKIGLPHCGENFLATTKNERLSTFASAIMGVLFSNSDAVDEMMEENFTDEEKSTIKKDIVSIVTKELNVKKTTLASSVLSSIFGGQSPETIVKQAIIDEAKKMASDKSCQVDIGV